MSGVAGLPGSGELRWRLGEALGDLRATLPFVVATEWASVDDLVVLEDAGQMWLHVESAGLGRIRVGPMFGPGHSCFSCYELRRVANGGGFCRPAPQDPTRAVFDALVDTLARQARDPDHLRYRQLEVTATGERGWHWCLPVPSCLQEHTDRGPGPTGLSLADLVDERLGIVNRVERLPGPDGWTALRAVGCRTDALGLVRAANSGLAVDPDADRAWTRAVGEAVERYCPAFPPEDARWGDGAQLPGDHLPHEAFPAARSEMDELLPAWWVRAVRIRDGQDVWVPAALVHLPYTFAPGERRVEVLSSTGLAAGPGMEFAVEHALAEVIERDAFMRAWRSWHGRTPRQTPSGPGTFVLELAAPAGWHVAVVSLESDAPPYGVMGIAARRDGAESVAAAESEAQAGLAWVEEWRGAGPVTVPEVPRTLQDHARLHAESGSLVDRRRAWLSGARPSRALKAPARPGCDDAVVVDLTTPDVISAGLKVVRVLAPGLVPLDNDAAAPLLAGDPTPHPLA